MHAETGEAFETVAAERAAAAADPPHTGSRWGLMTQDSGDDDREAEAAPYEVGYGRPPKATRFKPGKSGNPGGRPEGLRASKSRIADVVVEKMKALVLEEAYRPIQIRDGDQLVELPVMQAVLRSEALQAAKKGSSARSAC